MHRVYLRSLGIALLLLFTLAMLPFVGETAAEAYEHLNSSLRGSYAITVTQTCVLSKDGFDPVTHALLSDSLGTPTYILQGIISFDGDQTETFEGIALGITPQKTLAGDIPVSESDFACEGVYTVHPDKTVTLAAGTCTGTVFMPDSNPDRPYELISGGGNLVKFSQDNKVITYTKTGPEVDTITLYLPEYGNFPWTFQRICGRTGTGVKIHKRDSDD